MKMELKKTEKAVDLALECVTQLNTMKNEINEIKKKVNKMPPIIDDDIIENKVLLEDSRENNHNTVTSEELRFVERFNNTRDFSNNWEKNLEKVKVIEKKLRENEKIALESICLLTS